MVLRVHCSMKTTIKLAKAIRINFLKILKSSKKLKTARRVHNEEKRQLSFGNRAWWQFIHVPSPRPQFSDSHGVMIQVFDVDHWCHSGQQRPCSQRIMVLCFGIGSLGDFPRGLPLFFLSRKLLGLKHPPGQHWLKPFKCIYYL